MKRLIITNNPKVNERFKNKYQMIFVPDAGHLEILVKARDLIHRGAHLVIAPDAGNIKPHETPYRTVVLDACGAESACGTDGTEGTDGAGSMGSTGSTDSAGRMGSMGTPGIPGSPGDSPENIHSIVLIEESIGITDRLLRNTACLKYNDDILDDLGYIDCELIAAGIGGE